MSKIHVRQERTRVDQLYLVVPEGVEIVTCGLQKLSNM